MMLGKRARPPMKRTTSMSEITFDLNTTDHVVDPNNNNPFNNRDPSWWKQQPPHHHHHDAAAAAPIGLESSDQSRVLATVSPRNLRKQYSADLEADFLRSCSLCKRRLVPSRDIYMYRGDSAFCSLECRQRQMNKDERKDKCCVASKKQVVVTPRSGSQVAT